MTYRRRKSMLNDWSHRVRAILKKYCPGNIKKILPSSQSAWNTRFYFGHQKLCMDNNTLYCCELLIQRAYLEVTGNFPSNMFDFLEKTMMYKFRYKFTIKDDTFICTQYCC